MPGGKCNPRNATELHLSFEETGDLRPRGLRAAQRLLDVRRFVFDMELKRFIDERPVTYTAAGPTYFSVKICV